MIYYLMHLSPSFSFMMPHQSHRRFFHSFFQRTIYIYSRVMPNSHAILNDWGKCSLHCQTIFWTLLANLSSPFLFWHWSFTFHIHGGIQPLFLHLFAMLEWNLNEHWYPNCHWMVVYSYQFDKMKYISNSHVKIYIVYMKIYIDNCNSK